MRDYEENGMYIIYSLLQNKKGIISFLVIPLNHFLNRGSINVSLHHKPLQ